MSAPRNDEIIEQAARAIYETQGNTVSWYSETMGEWRRDYEREKAIAALNAVDYWNIAATLREALKDAQSASTQARGGEMRVTDEMVKRYLIWARNYGEIQSFSIAADSGRKWLIKLPEGATVTASGMEPGWIERSIVPDELMFTSREALAFGMGLALAGSRSEPRLAAQEKWGWRTESAGAS